MEYRDRSIAKAYALKRADLISKLREVRADLARLDKIYVESTYDNWAARGTSKELEAQPVETRKC